MLSVRNFVGTAPGHPPLRVEELSVRPGALVFAWQHSAAAVTALCDLLSGRTHFSATGGALRLDGRSLLPLSPLERLRRGLVVLDQTEPARGPRDFTRLIRHANRLLRLQGAEPLPPLEAIRATQELGGWLETVSDPPGRPGAPRRPRPAPPPANVVLLYLLRPRLAVLPILRGAPHEVASMLRPDPFLPERERPGILVVTDDPGLASRLHPDQLVHPPPEVLIPEAYAGFSW